MRAVESGFHHAVEVLSRDVEAINMVDRASYPSSLPRLYIDLQLRGVNDLKFYTTWTISTIKRPRLQRSPPKGDLQHLVNYRMTLLQLHWYITVEGRRMIIVDRIRR
jgi:hypothetical protein